MSHTQSVQAQAAIYHAAVWLARKNFAARILIRTQTPYKTFSHKYMYAGWRPGLAPVGSERKRERERARVEDTTFRLLTRHAAAADVAAHFLHALYKYVYARYMCYTIYMLTRRRSGKSTAGWVR